MTNKLLDRGFTVYKHESGNRYYVFVGEFNNWNTANSTLSEVKKVVASAYIKKIDFTLNKTEPKTVENLPEKNYEEKSNDVVRQETEEKEVEKKSEVTSENIDLDFYKEQSGYKFKNGYLSEIKGDKYTFSFPNGETKSYNFSNKTGREVNSKNGYLLVFKKEQLIDLLPQKTKSSFFKTLKELGYNNGINLNPGNSEFNFALPISKNIINKEIFLELYLEKAEFLNKTTYLDVFINNYHLKAIKLNDQKNVQKYVINLNNPNIELKDNLNIKISTNFSNDGLKSSLKVHNEKSWIKLHNNSKVHFTIKEQPTYNINNFVNMEVKKIRLFHGPNLSRNLIEKYIKTATRLNRKYNNKVSNIYLSDGKKASDLNNIYNRTRNIIISEEFETTELLDNLTLKLASKDADFFLSDYNELINTNKLKLNNFKSMERGNTNLNSYRKNNNNIKKGWGNIEYEYFIPANIFKNNPKEINVHLTGSYFIPFNNQAYLKVYLNGKLLKVEKLKKSQYFEEKIINIPGQEIESYNNLIIVFSQFPGKNINQYSNIMETYINPESYITYSGDILRKNNFQHLLSHFSGKGKILLEENNIEASFKAAVLFNKYLHQNDFSTLDFTVDYLDNYNIGNEDKDLKWYLVIGADSINDKFKSRVKLANQNIQINTRQNEENISINFNKPVSYIDFNTIDNKSVLFINTNGSCDNLEKMLIEINSKEGIHDLNGNLLIFNGESYKTFNIENQNLSNKFNISLSQFKNLFYKYKIHAYMISVVLIILILIWIYYKTSRNKKRKD